MVVEMGGWSCRREYATSSCHIFFRLELFECTLFNSISMSRSVVVRSVLVRPYLVVREVLNQNTIRMQIVTKPKR